MQGKGEQITLGCLCEQCGKSLFEQIRENIKEMTWDDFKSEKTIAECCNIEYIADTSHKMDCVSCGEELEMCGWDPIFGEPMFRCVPCKREQGRLWNAAPIRFKASQNR